MATYDIDYNDKRFQQVANEEATALREVKGTYDNMVNESNGFYQQQIDASKDWANQQSELQQAQTDFAIEKVEQAKDQAYKQYTREQKGAYTDYQKATNEYGANAEVLATQGLNQTGYSESTRTNAYNTYQNRYMSARESYNQAILNYDNSIKEAQLANNSALATIAYEALQKQLELSLQGFQYKNQLLLQKVDAVNQTKDRYYTRWQNVQQQINTENTLAEQVRQYNESLAFQKQQAAQEQARWEKEYALAQASARSSGGGGSSGGSGGSAKLKDTSGSAGSGALTAGVSGAVASQNKGSGTVKLSNGKTGYSSAIKAYKAKGGKDMASEDYILKWGLVNKTVQNGKTYYY